MKCKWKKIVVLTAILASSISATLVTEAATDQEAPSSATTNFKAPDEDKEVDPSDPEDPDPEPIKPWDPDDPNPPIYPGGPLRLNHVPIISFGVNNISARDATYSAQFETVIDKDDATNQREPKASFVEVADETGELLGWKVTVSSNGIFKSKDKGNVKGIITLKSGNVRGLDGMNDIPEMFPTASQLIIIGSGSIGNKEVMTAETGSGMNKWQVKYGSYVDTAEFEIGDDKTKRNPFVTLTVPKGQVILSGQKYVAEVLWTLEQGL